MTSSDWLNLAGTLFATFLGAWLGYLLAGKQEKARGKALHETLRNALLAEVELCARQATTYLEQNIAAPAYRLPTVVHDSVLSELLGTGELKAPQVTAIVEFYSQVRQINWCIDKIVDHYAREDAAGAQQEYARTRAKAEELRSPASRFYTPAFESLRRQG